MVIELKTKPRSEPFAPTATFRWAKSSPSAPAVLQQLWINPRQDGVSEWREVENVVLGNDPPSDELLTDLVTNREPRHIFKPHKRYPWQCAECGYGPGETLKHFPDETARDMAEIAFGATPETCPVCDGDCAAANPPVTFCPMRDKV